jgi:fluoride exporter
MLTKIKMKPLALFLVGIGGFLGAISRYLLGLVVAHAVGTNWPYGTFVINVTGCFAVSFYLTLATERLSLREGWRLFFPVGFVGAYTTFSTYEYETLKLIERGAWGSALAYVALSTLVGFAAVVAAASLARRVRTNRRTEAFLAEAERESESGVATRQAE